MAENVLWENPECRGKTLPPDGPAEEKGAPVWMNFGGDKVWPTEQSQWPKTNGYAWPPDHWFDGGAHSVRLLEDGVEIKGGVSGFNGGRSIREIRLAPNGTRVTIRQKIEKVKAGRNASAEPVPFTNWNVTQIRQPEMILLPLNPKSKFAERWYDYSGEKRECAKNVTVEGDVADFRPDSVISQKIGADSGPWIAGIVGNCLIAEMFERDPKAVYPDGGLSETVYTCPQYSEIELMSPFKSLKIGEVLIVRHRLGAASAARFLQDGGGEARGGAGDSERIETVKYRICSRFIKVPGTSCEAGRKARFQGPSLKKKVPGTSEVPGTFLRNMRNYNSLI